VEGEEGAAKNLQFGVRVRAPKHLQLRRAWLALLCYLVGLTLWKLDSRPHHDGGTKVDTGPAESHAMHSRK
jgi:hypothetical protein